MSVFVWVVRACLAVFGLELLVGIYVYDFIGDFIHNGSLCSRVGQERADAQLLIDWGTDDTFLLINSGLLFALLTILLMWGFQERMLDMFIPRYVVTGTFCICVLFVMLSYL